MVLAGTQRMNRLRVLTYQKIGTPPKHTPFKNEWTSLRTLQRTLAHLQKRKIATVSPAQILAGEIPARAVLLLFLDGYRSFYTDVYPLLKEYQLAACVCLPPACLSTYNTWQDPHQEFWQDLLAKDEIKTLGKDPLISFGAQALTREDLTLLPDEQARQNARESVFRLSRFLPKQPKLFAVFPAKNQLKNAAQLLPGFNGLIVTPDEISGLSCRTSVMRGNRWGIKWKL